jgi:hypothetical protein
MRRRVDRGHLGALGHHAFGFGALERDAVLLDA